MQILIDQLFIRKVNRRREDVIYHGLHGFAQILIIFEIKKICVNPCNPWCIKICANPD